MSSYVMSSWNNSFILRIPGAVVAEWLACSPPTKANRVQFPARSLPDFHTCELWQAMPLVSGFSRGSPVYYPTLSFRRRSILTSITLIGFETSLLRVAQFSSLTQDTGNPCNTGVLATLHATHLPRCPPYSRRNVLIRISVISTNWNMLTTALGNVRLGNCRLEPHRLFTVNLALFKDIGHRNITAKFSRWLIDKLARPAPFLCENGYASLFMKTSKEEKFRPDYIVLAFREVIGVEYLCLRTPFYR
ncbi:hypothetical protein PR048_033335 [Dryococelus australis]|uniref:Uncharacterized protein n=1 Tax=Dryococelus australis TaxID=614101 RepID=A0ABQ9G3C2_9NEOP|nr:hypothetical protein PR048_033335 [Dryococelus australis]